MIRTSVVAVALLATAGTACAQDAELKMQADAILQDARSWKSDLLPASAALEAQKAQLMMTGDVITLKGSAMWKSAQALALLGADMAPMSPSLSLGFQARGLGSSSAEQAERKYERASRALDKRAWDEAVTGFDEVAAMGGNRADGALYWKAYALGKLGRIKEAQASLDTLAKNHPQSRWLNDAKALGLELSQASGKPVSPDQAGSDEELKLIAINGLMGSDPERAVPLLEKVLQSRSSPKLREQALFILSQSDSPKARDILMRAAKGEMNPDLQMKAVQNLGVFGGKKNQQLLSEIYSSTSDPAIKRQVLRTFMISGVREPLLTIAKSDPSAEMRSAAIQQLGVMGAASQLSDLYASESSPEIRAQILRGLMVGGASQKLMEVARSEKDKNLRMKAIEYAGASGPQTGDGLVAMYQTDNDTEIRSRILRALMIQGNAKQLVEIARKEQNPELKKAAVQYLSHMNSKEGTEYLMELLK